MFSRRTAWDFTPNELVLARRRAGEASALLDLTVSNPTSVGLSYPADPILDAFHRSEALIYEPSCVGLSSTRAVVAGSYRADGVDVDPGHIVLTASSSEAYSYLLKLLCDSGDSILVPRPSYPLFDDLARLESVRIKGYPLRGEDGWRIDMAALRDAVDDRTRAIFVVSPNNPTGSYLVREERDALESVASERGLAIVCDEVFSDYVWRDDPGRVRCAADGASVLTFSLGGLSKSVCLPQMKLGWIVAGGPRAHRAEALQRLEMIGDTFLSVGTPVQHAAAGLLECGRPVREALCERIQTNLRVLREVFAPPLPVSAMPVDAGWYAVLRLPRIMSGEAWCTTLVEADGVLTHPGEFFGFEQEGCLVISLIAQPKQFDQGVRAIAARVVGLAS